MSKDTLEISLSGIEVRENGVSDEEVTAVLLSTWGLPRENVQSVSTAMPIPNVTDGFAMDFSNSSYMEKVLFKQQRSGTSYLKFELAVTQDPGIAGKIMTAVLGNAISTIANPLWGTVLGAVLNHLKIDEEKVTTIGKGNVEIGDSEFDCAKKIVLKVPRRIYVREEAPGEDPFVEEEDEEEDEIKVIRAGAENCVLKINIERL